MKAENIKQVVKEKYGEIARQSNIMAPTSCCGGTVCCGDVEFSMIGDDYKNLAGYNPDADLGLGCGVPTEFAGIKEGDNVLDLGSGAGNDCFVARSIVGENRKGYRPRFFAKRCLKKQIKTCRKQGLKILNLYMVILIICHYRKILSMWLSAIVY